MLAVILSHPTGEAKYCKLFHSPQNSLWTRAPAISERLLDGSIASERFLSDMQKVSKEENRMASDATSGHSCLIPQPVREAGMFFVLLQYQEIENCILNFRRWGANVSSTNKVLQNAKFSATWLHTLIRTAYVSRRKDGKRSSRIDRRVTRHRECWSWELSIKD